MFPIRDHNPSARTPYVTIALIVANVAVFLWQMQFMGSERELLSFWDQWAMVPRKVMAGQDLHTLVTSMFLHGGLAHIGGNMLFLWIFGDNLEDQMGHAGFLAFYLVCGLAAAGAHLAADPSSPYPTVGASGAIAGVMGGYLLLFPRARVDVLLIIVFFIRIVPVPAFVMLGVWFVFQIFAGVGDPSSGDGVAYWAHAGGFVAGLLIALGFWLRRGASGFWRANQGQPPYPGADYRRSSIPVVRRRRR